MNLSLQFDPTTHPHRRYNPLADEYVLVSPHRNKRPWQGQTEALQPTDIPTYDPECYLCPGNSRADGMKNAVYDKTMVFVNDFAAILPPPIPMAPLAQHPLLTAEPVYGGCDVIIFNPRHDLTLPRLSIPDVERIITEWCSIYQKRGTEPGIKYVQIFENKGAMMGCSNPHPHGQVWSLSAIPSLPAKELEAQRRYSSRTDLPHSNAPRGPLGRPSLLLDYTHFEIHNVPLDEGRVVARNEHWVALVPWWATWPFEILLTPYHRHVSSVLDLSEQEKSSFALILSQVTKRYDNLFSCSFPYSMGFHQRPIPFCAGPGVLEEEDEHSIAHLHLHFCPPLLRSASIRKFLVGFELLAEPQRDLTPEQSAARLRTCGQTHYLDKSQQKQ